MNRNSELIMSFAQYCAEHPEQRFWQALRNWSKADVIEFKDYWNNRMDTFHWEGRDGQDKEDK